MSQNPLVALFTTPGGPRVALRLLIMHRNGIEWATAEEIASQMFMSEVRVKHILQILTERRLVERRERISSNKRGPKPYEYKLSQELLAAMGVI